jgi:hypothetical protein
MLVCLSESNQSKWDNAIVYHIAMVPANNTVTHVDPWCFNGIIIDEIN